MARNLPFNRLWANAPTNPGDPSSFSAPSNDRIDHGWEGGLDKDAPQAGEQNWWQARADSALQDIERYGAMAWNAQSQYSIGAPCYGSDGQFYESIINANVNNDPVTTPSAWRVVGLSLYGAFQPGDAKMVWHNGVPDAGWLKCNGAVVLRNSYPRLFAKIGTAFNSGGELVTQFRLPDARGVFIRGFDDSRGQDPGRSFGSFQSDELKSHSHTTKVNLDRSPPTDGNLVYGDENYYGTYYLTTSAYGGNETRPKNITAVYWIRY